ncbi:YopX family protein [Lactiplantibacillus plantarum]|uniref:YopX family protein n=1 Tax=Lactiplantibacillus plantarum TaxID=1590 RepID=UPI00223F3877|nr:YopX family protein [Lactiplantibacillus plantarum]
MIKFRAWDKENEIYLYNVQDAYDTLSGFVKYDDGEDAEYDEYCFGDFLDNKRYDTEQFTGLKDVNDKDIYEGDVLKTKAGLIQIVEQGILETDREDIINGFYANNLSDEKPHTFSYDDEVIGNVHENPELLEADK